MNKHTIRLTIYAVLTVTVMVAIFMLSSQNASLSSKLSRGFLHTGIGKFLASVLPRLTKKGIFNDIRKYAHIFEYFCMGITSCLFFTELDDTRRLRSALYSAAFSVLYACTDEFHQIFVPGRSGQVLDVCIDAAGIILGVALTFLTVKALRRIK